MPRCQTSLRSVLRTNHCEAPAGARLDSTHQGYTQFARETLSSLRALLRRTGLIILLASTTACQTPGSVDSALLQRTANDGDPLSQHTIAEAYLEGKDGFDQDDDKAAQWFERAAIQNFARSQFALGWMYLHGRGVSEDIEKATGLFRQAAEQGLPEAQYFLGVRYKRGEGAPQDYTQAAHWYLLAAESGWPSAQNDLSALYAQGLGVPQDDAKAFYWAEKAARSGIPNAQFNLALYYQEGKGVERNMNASLMWAKRAAENNLPGARTFIGVHYEHGTEAAEQSYTTAARYYREDAELGFMPAWRYLGLLHDQGRGVSQDTALAMDYFKRAAEAEDVPAMRMLGMVYMQKDQRREGFEWLAKASNRGDAEASYWIGYALAKDGDWESSIPYLAKARQGGFTRADALLNVAIDKVRRSKPKYRGNPYRSW